MFPAKLGNPSAGAFADGPGEGSITSDGGESPRSQGRAFPPETQDELHGRRLGPGRADHQGCEDPGIGEGAGTAILSQQLVPQSDIETAEDEALLGPLTRVSSATPRLEPGWLPLAESQGIVSTAMNVVVTGGGQQASSLCFRRTGVPTDALGISASLGAGMRLPSKIPGGVPPLSDKMALAQGLGRDDNRSAPCNPDAAAVSGSAAISCPEISSGGCPEDLPIAAVPDDHAGFSNSNGLQEGERHVGLVDSGVAPMAGPSRRAVAAGRDSMCAGEPEGGGKLRRISSLVYDSAHEVRCEEQKPKRLCALNWVLRWSHFPAGLKAKGP